MDVDFIKVLLSISHGIDCKHCPYPCDKEGCATQYDCDRHWHEILSSMDTSMSWYDIEDAIARRGNKCIK